MGNSHASFAALVCGRTDMLARSVDGFGLVAFRRPKSEYLDYSHFLPLGEIKKPTGKRRSRRHDSQHHLCCQTAIQWAKVI